METYKWKDKPKKPKSEEVRYSNLKPKMIKSKSVVIK